MDNTELSGKVTEIIDDIFDDYSGGRTVDVVKDFEHSDKEIIVTILDNLQKIIFPGYFKNKKYNVYTIKNNLTMLAEDVLYNLIKQIRIVLKYSSEKSYTDDEINRLSEEKALIFMSQIPKIREYIDTDIQAAFDGDPAAYNKAEIIFSYPGLYAIMVNRIAHELFLLEVPMIPRIMTEHAHSLTGIDIHPGATIGKYFFIDHGTGIVIGETTEIGNNVKIYQGVTLGALSTRGGQGLRGKKRHPTIEDNVTIYSGASILGGNTVVGKNVVIGGNVFITQSVPSGAKVSIKSQELSMNFDKGSSVTCEELDNGDNWFYVI
ncbi:MAG: serine O-acetyltransferase EpsC [Oscillospiraceae bacterium]